METALRKMGNSVGMIVPKAILQELGATVGTPLDVRVDAGRVIVTPLRKARSGWAEDAACLASHEITVEEKEWLDVAVEGDCELDW
ncbi:MAG: AbrB/MazE/SpoVT family DNA-binding domain-containing protein [Sphingomonas adhaesiva]|uniref:AbrB/MazE/SpoVT family DNA-binding domain-containing protein n=1 Tax=Sphingomonas adhaesiva TaxID=28212 RepID=UPI002FF7BA16